MEPLISIVDDDQAVRDALQLMLRSYGFTTAVCASAEQFLVSDQALIILGVLAGCEILAQKFPALDNVWDFVHTLLRPLAGAAAAGAVLTTHSAFEMTVAMLLGAELNAELLKNGLHSAAEKPPAPEDAAAAERRNR